VFHPRNLLVKRFLCINAWQLRKTGVPMRPRPPPKISVRITSRNVIRNSFAQDFRQAQAQAVTPLFRVSAEQAYSFLDTASISVPLYFFESATRVMQVDASPEPTYQGKVPIYQFFSSKSCEPKGRLFGLRDDEAALRSRLHRFTT
jgi:hypothetical protein